MKWVIINHIMVIVQPLSACHQLVANFSFCALVATSSLPLPVRIRSRPSFQTCWYVLFTWLACPPQLVSVKMKPCCS